MQTPKFATIPQPDGSVESLQKAMLVVIQVLQDILGIGAKTMQGNKSNRNMAHVFIQDTPPDALNPGDLWLCQNPLSNVSMWDGTRWLKLLDVPPV